MDVPFSETEKRFVLAEAIKNSSVPIDRLLIVLSEGQVTPAWQEMLLPHGRNLKSCIETFDALTSRPNTGFSPHLLSPFPTAASGSTNKRKSAPDNFEFSLAGQPQKRRQSGGDAITTTRTLQPKPSSNGSPQSFSPMAAGQQPKKRGRPSKADVEARNAEAIARGEVIPPPKPPTPKNPQIVGMGHFDPRSPIQREIVPSPRVLAPSPALAGDSGPGYLSTHVYSPVAAIAPMPMSPSQPPLSGMGQQIEPPESDSTTASGKKKRSRPSSKTKSPKVGEGSFRDSEPGLIYNPAQTTAAPPSEHPRREEASRSGAEQLPPIVAQLPPTDIQQPAP